MIDTIYLEDLAAAHPRAQRILRRHPQATVVRCSSYTEVFNPRAQDFRLQKQRPALILALKAGRKVLEAPSGYGVGGERNFYFSHMLNCLYDCRYCFLQGKFRSAHYVVFVNFEEFVQEIDEVMGQHPTDRIWFFSGYDCDSLALEPVTGFAEFFAEAFRERPRGMLELRTKSTQIRSLLKRDPVDNVVAAFSFTPDSISRRHEHRVPAVRQRIRAARELQRRGWRVALRFDPLIADDRFEQVYRDLFDELFGEVEGAAVDSVSLGSFRLPRAFHASIGRLYPDEPLLQRSLRREGATITYGQAVRDRMLVFCHKELTKHLSPARIFLCGT